MVIRWSKNRNITEASYSLSRLTAPSSPDPLSDLAGLKQLCCPGSCSQITPADDTTGNKSSSGTTSLSVSPGPALARRGQPPLNFFAELVLFRAFLTTMESGVSSGSPWSTEGSGGSSGRTQNSQFSRWACFAQPLFFYSILSSFSRFEELLEQ